MAEADALEHRRGRVAARRAGVMRRISERHRRVLDRA